jgi:hypothetical protein
MNQMNIPGKAGAGRGLRKVRLQTCRGYILGTNCLFLESLKGFSGMIRHGTIFLIAFFLLMALVIPGSAVNTGVNTIAQGGDVFIGEEGLDISNCIGNTSQMAWFGPGTSPSVNVPDYVLTVSDPTNFYVSPEIFTGRPGLYYQWSGSSPAGPLAINILDPYIEMSIISQSTLNVASFGIIPQGDFLNFWASTNIWTVTSRPGYNASVNGPFTFRVKSPGGAIYTALYQNNSYVVPLTGISINSTDATWVPYPPPMESGWNTGVTDLSGTVIYPTGLYEVTLECDLNGMKDNYKDQDGTDYVGKTITYPHPVEIISDSVDIAAKNTSIVRGNQFAVTITGMPSTAYIIWVENTGQMTGLPQDRPPALLPSQSGLKLDRTGGPYTYGEYQFEGGGGRTVREDVPVSPDNGTVYYGLVTLSSSGTRTIAWQTSTVTKDKRYTIRVERGPPGPDGMPPVFSNDTEYKTASVDVRVEKGMVTIAAAGGQSSLPGQGDRLPDRGSVTGTGTPTPSSETPPPVITAHSTSTPTPSPRPTPAQGFEGGVAIIGFGAVMFLINRRS